jgi:hypothetical protein
MIGRDAPATWRNFLRATTATVERSHRAARRLPRLLVVDADVDVAHPASPPEVRLSRRGVRTTGKSTR